MCGFVGMIHCGQNKRVEQNELAKCADMINHRGPDSRGYWFSEHKDIGFAFNRLSILDISSAGNQPMVSGCERYVLVFNGEIYNHLEIRKQLDEQPFERTWNGNSDTETFLKAISIFGIKDSLSKIRGMFAFAVWDRKAKVLTLSRDRMGEKPLYWSFQDNTFFFSSELKALEVSPKFQCDIDQNAVSLLMDFNYIPSPFCIYKNTYKLRPGSVITFDLKSKDIQETYFWRLLDVIEAAKSRSLSSIEEVEYDFENLLSQVIQEQMLSHVPLGTFLSGGIDSSLVTTIAQSHVSTPIETFTVGFEDLNYDEAPYARDVASYLGTKHNELYVREKDAISAILGLAEIYCEPFADSSQIPFFLLSKYAKTSVTVALSGDGGDELFGGYNAYSKVPQLWNIMKHIPMGLRKMLNKFQEKFQSNKNISAMCKLAPASDQYELYELLLHQWGKPNRIVKKLGYHDIPLTDEELRKPKFDFVEWMMMVDAMQYLPDDILTKVDRASMANSLEVRAPLLDPRIVEFAWRLPRHMKFSQKDKKLLLKKMLNKRIPRCLTDRPKKGFSVPINAWLKGPLHSWADSLLNEPKIEADGIFDASLVCRAWRQHQNGEVDNSRKLWNVLMFQNWLASRR